MRNKTKKPVNHFIQMKIRNVLLYKSKYLGRNVSRQLHLLSKSKSSNRSETNHLEIRNRKSQRKIFYVTFRLPLSLSVVSNQLNERHTERMKRRSMRLRLTVQVCAVVSTRRHTPSSLSVFAAAAAAATYHNAAFCFNLSIIHTDRC